MKIILRIGCKVIIFATIVFLLLAVFAVQGSSASAEADDSIYVIEIHGEISDAMAAYVDREISEAVSSGASAVMLDIDTWGGFLTAADSMHASIAACPVPVIAYVSVKAVSAGVMIAVSSDYIFMAPGTHMGAAEPIPFSEKVLSAWVGMLSSAAEQNHWPVDVVSAMADKRIAIEGLTEEGQLLSVTPEQAVAFGVCDAVARSRTEAAELAGYREAGLVVSEVTMADSFARFITSGTALNILFILGILFAVMEIFTAGFGIFGILSIVCFGLYFFGGFLAGYTHWWAIALFIAGAVFLVIEIFMPGFGVFGIAGLVLIFLGLVLSARDFSQFAVRAGLAVLVCLAVIPAAVKLFGKTRIFQRFINTESENTEQGFTAGSAGDGIVPGQKGVALTDLRPSGTARIEGKRLDVVAAGGYIARGSEITVVKSTAHSIQVE